ncbi:hypothetical protein SBDP1_660007 [Syntrophobacter sp. SbD1]|nr:hypothetical protein SBDP1_660007 [Syntrophobacter sp. SbD1]
MKNVGSNQCPQRSCEVGRGSGGTEVEDHCRYCCGDRRNQPRDGDSNARDRTGVLVYHIGYRGKSDQHSERMRRIDQEIERKNSRDNGASEVYGKHHFIGVIRTRRAETHSEKGNGVPVVEVVFNRDSADGNIDHAADNAQEQERKEILRRNSDLGKCPGKQAELDQPKSQQEHKQEYESEENEKRWEKHLTNLSETYTLPPAGSTAGGEHKSLDYFSL